MSKAFWQGFKQGYLKFFWVGFAFAFGLALGTYIHPYERCNRMYSTPEDVGECMWIIQEHSN